MAEIVSSTGDEQVLLRRDAEGIATLTLNRPSQYNALSETLLDTLQDALDGIAGDKSVRVVVIGGNGPAFCAGHDLKEIQGKADQVYYEALFKKSSRVMITLTKLPQPVVARVHGIATAAGCQLVAACDLAVASSEARFATSGIDVGLFCMTPGVALSRKVARKNAFEMLFTGEFIGAERAAEIGLINRVAAPEALDAAVEELVRVIAAKSAAAIAAGKEVFYRQVELGLEAAYDYASTEMARNLMFHDAGEGIDAFVAKRKPVWLDR